MSSTNPNPSEPLLPCQLTMLAVPENVRAAVAWHEVGHVVVAKLLGARVESVTLHADGNALSRVWAAPETLLKAYLAGFLNERLFLPPDQWITAGADHDVAEASRYATEIVGRLYASARKTPSAEGLAKRAGLLLELKADSVRELLAANRMVSRTIFKALFDLSSLDTAAVNELFAEGVARQREDDRRMRARR